MEIEKSIESVSSTSAETSFSIVVAGQTYYHCKPCGTYYNADAFFPICIQRRYHRCSACYSKFNKTAGKHDSINRPSNFYANQLNRARIAYKTHWMISGEKADSDVLDIEVVRCVMVAWGHRSYLSGEQSEFSLCRWNPAVEVGLRPENLMIFSKEEVRKSAHKRLWRLASESEEVSQPILEDLRDFRLRLYVLLNMCNRREVAESILNRNPGDRLFTVR